MPETQASIGYGITFEMADVATPTNLDYVSEIYNLELGSEETDQIDGSHSQSPDKMREYIDGLTEPGQTSFEMNYIPGSVSDLLMIAARGVRKWCRVTFPNGVQVMFRGSRQSYSVSNPHDAKQTASVTFQRSGRPIQTEPTAPRNLVAGLITGTAKVGVPLTEHTLGAVRRFFAADRGQDGLTRHARRAGARSPDAAATPRALCWRHRRDLWADHRCCSSSLPALRRHRRRRLCRPADVRCDRGGART